MENTEALLMELEEFNRGNEEDKQISQNLEQFIEYVAKTGKYIFPWYRIRKLYLNKLKCVLNNLTSLNTSGLNTSAYLDNSINEPNGAQSIKEIKDRIMERMESFNSAPFTIQRISELILKPNNHYTRIDKFLRGLEKCIMVVTTVDPNGNKIFIDNVYTNGVSDEGVKMGSLETPKKPNSILDQTSVNVEVVESESLNITIEQAKLEFPSNPDNNLITTTVCIESSVNSKSESNSTSQQIADTATTITVEKSETIEDQTANRDDQQPMEHESSQPEEEQKQGPTSDESVTLNVTAGIQAESGMNKESVSVELNISSSSSLVENKIDDDVDVNETNTNTANESTTTNGEVETHIDNKMDQAPSVDENKVNDQ